MSQARINTYKTAINDTDKQPYTRMVRLFWAPPALGRVGTDGSVQNSTAIRVFQSTFSNGKF